MPRDGPERLSRPVAVTPPAEIDMANAEDVGAQMRSAFTIQRTLTPGGTRSAPVTQAAVRRPRNT
jgi:hypothetical protein